MFRSMAQGARRGRRPDQSPAEAAAEVWAGQGDRADQQPPGPPAVASQGRRQGRGLIAWSAKPRLGSFR